ncbi:hypothetical protein HYH03_005414 [Edaphochlamys debaryana]|uniref:Uncharacterized protein n=1 Tax=Edaphochlamys debaryana TaxID=47281 RepID=A0A835Y571_9CHLO|nr:hypothetical protein HYH03_005414 [Edaphochlamys debaryana]|eukprot:KAG2496592.1 hypothetical protein HYH03_005414 [Edaphochlamys debaryana]
MVARAAGQNPAPRASHDVNVHLHGGQLNDGAGAKGLVSAAPPPAIHRPTAPHRRRANTDDVKLLTLGYRPELAREFTMLNCAGASINALSSLTAIAGTYSIGLLYGGPVVMAWGWLLVTAFTVSVGLSMSELASAYPTSGALYYWSYRLAPVRARNLACWVTVGGATGLSHMLELLKTNY